MSVAFVEVVVAFSSLARISGRLFDLSPRLRLFFFFLLFEVEISSRTLNPLFIPGSVHSGSRALRLLWPNVP